MVICTLSTELRLQKGSRIGLVKRFVQHVVDRPLAQVMIDAVDLLFLEGPQQNQI